MGMGRRRMHGTSAGGFTVQGALRQPPQRERQLIRYTCVSAAVCSVAGRLTRSAPEVDDGPHLAWAQRVKDDELVHAVHKLGAEVLAHLRVCDSITTSNMWCGEPAEVCIGYRTHGSWGLPASGSGSGLLVARVTARELCRGMLCTDEGGSAALPESQTQTVCIHSTRQYTTNTPSPSHPYLLQIRSITDNST